MKQTCRKLAPYLLEGLQYAPKHCLTDFSRRMGGLCGRMPRVALGLAPPLRVQVWEGFRAESGWRLLWVGTALRVQGRQAAARIRQTRVSVWAIPGGKMGGVAPEDGRDRDAKPPMLQRAFLRPLRSVSRGVCGIAAGRPSDGRSEAVNRQTGFAPPNSVFFLFPHT